MAKVTIDFPAQVNLVIVILNDETGATGEVKIGCGFGSECLTIESIRERIEKFAEEELSVIAPGFRIASNHEYFESACLKAFNQRIEVAGLVFGPDIKGAENKDFFSNVEHAGDSDDDFDNE